MLRVVLGTRAAQLSEELDHGVFGDAGHANGGADAVALDEGGHNPDALFGAQAIHTDQLCLTAHACQAQLVSLPWIWWAFPPDAQSHLWRAWYPADAKSRVRPWGFEP